MKTEGIKRVFHAWNLIFQEHVEQLTALDSAGGDGDLGVVMRDGFRIADEFVTDSDEHDIGKMIYMAGKKFNSIASSYMGTLISSGFMKIGKQLKGKEELKDAELAVLFQAMIEGVMTLGGAKEGEKTFLDALCPAQRAYAEHVDEGKARALQCAVTAAREGVEKAKMMQARHGRLAFRQENSIGMVDPGSVVAALYVEGIQQGLRDEE